MTQHRWGWRAALSALFVVTLIALAGGTAHAQVAGKVIGTVADADTGEPLIGAQVVVEGSNLGNITNEDGYYFVNNIPVGVQRITAQYLGYQVTSQDHRILAGQTTTIDFALSSEVVQAEGIVAVIEREPLVARDNTISKTRFTGEDAVNLPVDNIREVIELGAGIYFDNHQTGGTLEDAGGFIIRGGRASESATLIDGVLVTDFLNSRNRTELGAFAIEEVDVITGGFNAEFGNAQSGIINIVTRSGGREYHGHVRATTDEVDLEQSYGYNNLQASFGGPLVPGRLTFFGSVELTGAEDFFPAVAGVNPLDGFSVNPDGSVTAPSNGSTENLLPNNRGNRTVAQAKVTAFLPGNAKLTGTYLFSRDQFENYDHRLQLQQFRGFGRQRDRTHDIILGYDQQIFQSAERNLNLQVRANWHSTKTFIGHAKTPELAQVVFDEIGDRCGVECDITEDTFNDDFLNWQFSDIEFMFEDSTSGTVFNLPTTGSLLPDDVFGIPRLFFLEGILNTSVDDRRERRSGIRVDLDSQLTRVHRAKVGVEWTWVNLFRNQGNLEQSTFSDIFDVDPRIGAAYVQDRLDYGDLVIDVGLRWDHFDPNTMFPDIAGNVPCDIAAVANQCTEGAPATLAETQNEIAPRLGVAHPITDATQVRLSFGKFYQLPEFRHLFGAFLTNFPGNPNINYGNPELEFIETTAFEAGMTHLITDNVVLDVVGYNRDRRGAIRQQIFQPGELGEGVSERRIFINGDNGNVKGFDITLSKRFAGYFSTDLAWSLQWARGTSSAPLSFVGRGGFGRLTDPLNVPNLLTPPTELAPEDFDQLHNINYQFQLRFPNDFKEGTALGSVLQNAGVFLIYNAQSGNPFTRREPDARGAPLEALRSSRTPWVQSGDIRVTKGFTVGNGLDLSVFAFVQNFLNATNVFFVHEGTGRPDFNGFEDQDRARVPTEFLVDTPSTTTFPYLVTDVIEFDTNGNVIRANIANQDLNNDGVITFDEAAAILLEVRRVAHQVGGPQQRIFGDQPSNYGEPRQIRIGAEIRF